MTEKWRVAIRADASGAMGTGHVRRCLALAQALSGMRAAPLFVCRRHDAVSSHVLPQDYPCCWLPGSALEVASPPAPDALTSLLAPDALNENISPYVAWGGVSWQQDADETINVLKQDPPQWLVVDHYAWDARWHQRVRSALGCKVVVIDDLADRLLDADLVLNQNIHADHQARYEKILDPKRLKRRFLFGPQFALLSGAYATAPRYVFSETVRSIGIFMGGTDPDDISSQALKACREVAQFKGQVVLVSSSVSRHHAHRQALAATWPQTHVVADLPDLASFFAEHDLQIGSGGGAAWERCCIGAPTLACTLAANQDAVLPQLAAAGALELVDVLTSDSPSRVLGEKVRSLIFNSARRHQLSLQASRWVDGQGARRVAAAMLLAIHADLRLRRVVSSDEQLLLGWSNDTQTRLNAFSPNMIQPQTHSSWLRLKLSQPEHCVFLIAEAHNGVPVGTIRFDFGKDHFNDNEKVWRLSYSIDPAFRGLGLGLGRALVELGSGFMAKVSHAPSVLQALVKVDNYPSVKIFASMRFTKAETEHAGQAAYCFQKPLGRV